MKTKQTISENISLPVLTRAYTQTPVSLCGPGSKTSDSVYLRLEFNGEYVLSSRRVLGFQLQRLEVSVDEQQPVTHTIRAP